MEKSWDLAEKITVTKVQRVENPRLYIEYMTSMKSLFGRVNRIKPLSASNESEVNKLAIYI